MKIKKIISTFLIFLLLSILFTNCYATAVVVTKENLNESFQNMASQTRGLNFTVSDNTITINFEDQIYTLTYDLTSNPTFVLEMPIEQGMSYDYFYLAMSYTYLPMFPWMAVANIQGVDDFMAAEDYFYDTFTDDSQFDDILQNNMNQYEIVDDINRDVDKDENNPNIIYTSEFGERAVEYVTNVFKDKITISDSANGINSYVTTIELKDVTDSSCKLVCTLTVNLDADFSKMSNFNDTDNNNSASNNNDNNNNYSNNIELNTETNEPQQSTPTDTDNTIATPDIPQTAVNNIVLYIAIAFIIIIIIAIVLIIIKLRKDK